MEVQKIPKISAIFESGISNLKNKKFQRIANNLKWRQQYQSSRVYPLTIGSGDGDCDGRNTKKELTFTQIDNGEMRGLGTGAVVWPAAHVLVKYLEKRYGGINGMRGQRVIDIGSGTGFAGIAAAALGAEVVLTDQLCVRDLILSNIERFHEIDSEANVTFAEYNWDDSAESLNPPFDLVLVSDCVLPKLYPIEPLVKVHFLASP
jgi:2-polyprenyl-3-methyl-5-hydroxy-6-metoxy-1,4-benzoquinol methylase